MASIAVYPGSPVTFLSAPSRLCRARCVTKRGVRSSSVASTSSVYERLAPGEETIFSSVEADTGVVGAWARATRVWGMLRATEVQLAGRLAVSPVAACAFWFLTRLRSGLGL